MSSQDPSPLSSVRVTKLNIGFSNFNLGFFCFAFLWFGHKEIQILCLIVCRNVKFILSTS
jgi:hypothetical protein